MRVQSQGSSGGQGAFRPFGQGSADRDKARRLGAQGRVFVNREYAFDPYIARMKRVFLAMMEGRAPAAEDRGLGASVTT